MTKRDAQRFSDLVLGLTMLGRAIIIAVMVWALGWWALPLAVLLWVYDVIVGPMEQNAYDWKQRLRSTGSRL